MKTKIITSVILCLVLTAGVINATNYIDYSTREYFEGDRNDKTYRMQEVVTQDSEGISLEFNINYAQVEPWFMNPEYVVWYVPGCNMDYFDEGHPLIPYWIRLRDLPKGFTEVSVSDLEYEYIDFSGYKIAPGIAPEPDGVEAAEGDGEDESEPTIEPYQGFFPTEILTTEVGTSMGQRELGILLATLQYDYENTIVRAYTHIKFRINFLNPEGISHVGEDSSQPIYYNLQGIRIDQPQPGEMYLERKKNSVSKIIK